MLFKTLKFNGDTSNIACLTKKEWLEESQNFLYDELKARIAANYNGPQFQIKHISESLPLASEFTVVISFGGLVHTVWTSHAIWAENNECYLKLIDVLVAIDGISLEIYQQTEDFILSNGNMRGLKLIDSVVDDQGFTHLIRRLPPSLTIQGDFCIQGLAKAVVPPLSLTVNGNVTASDSTETSVISPKLVPRELVVNGNMQVSSICVFPLPSRLTVNGDFTTTSRHSFGNFCQCESLTLHSMISPERPGLDLNQVLINKDVRVLGFTQYLTNIKAPGDIMLALDNCLTITNIRCGGKLSIKHSSKLEKIDYVHCSDLYLHKVNLKFFGVVEAKTLTIEQSDFKALPDCLNLATLILKICVKLKTLPKYGVVYGDMVIPPHVTIPPTFCCLGQVSVEI